MGNFGSRGGLSHAVPVTPKGVSRKKKDTTLYQSALDISGTINELEPEPFIDLRCNGSPDSLRNLAGATESRIDDDG